MKEDKTAPKLTFIILRETFAICRLDKDAPIPDWAFQGGLFSITRTKDELSTVCPQINVPKGILCNQEWSCLKVEPHGQSPWHPLHAPVGRHLPSIDGTHSSTAKGRGLLLPGLKGLWIYLQPGLFLQSLQRLSRKALVYFQYPLTTLIMSWWKRRIWKRRSLLLLRQAQKSNGIKVNNTSGCPFSYFFHQMTIEDAIPEP